MKVDLGSGELNDTGWHFIDECQKRGIKVEGPLWVSCKEILQSCIEFYHRKLHRRVRHKKRGHTYQVLGEGEVQVSTIKLSGGQSLPIGLGKIRQRMLTEGDKLIVYRDEQTNKLWLRFPDEFEDGRFEEVK